MPLDPSIIKRERIRVGTSDKGEALFVDVRGLTAQDFAVLFGEEESAMAALFSDAFSWDSGEMIVKEVIIRLPALAALAMSLACEDVENADLYAQLPISKQIEILSAVYQLTLPEADSKKKIQQGVGVILGGIVSQNLRKSGKAKG